MNHNHSLTLTPVEMTPALMAQLEDLGLIIRLCPNHHELPVKPGENRDQLLYHASSGTGPHSLISVAINSPKLGAFGTHPENEEFLLIGDPAARPLYLVIAKIAQEELDDKIQHHLLSVDDFVCLHITYNDPAVSFFTMLANVPHGEMAGEGAGRPATFYVTEPLNLDTELTDFKDYTFTVSK